MVQARSAPRLVGRGERRAGSGAECREHVRAPAPAGARHDLGDGFGFACRVGLEGCELVEQRLGGELQGLDFAGGAGRDGDTHGFGHAARRRQAEFRRAHEGVEFQHVARRETGEPQAARDGRGVAQHGRRGCRVAQMEEIGHLARRHLDDLAVGGDGHGAAQAGDQDGNQGGTR